MLAGATPTAREQQAMTAAARWSDLLSELYEQDVCKLVSVAAAAAVVQE
jgi:hypothetical protein